MLAERRAHWGASQGWGAAEHESLSPVFKPQDNWEVALLTVLGASRDVEEERHQTSESWCVESGLSSGMYAVRTPGIHSGSQEWEEAE